VRTEQELSLARARGDRWLPERDARSVSDAAAFVDSVGFALLFPADRFAAPSLYEAVAGPDAVAWQHGMGEAESAVWDWKDELPASGTAWYGKFLFKRASLLSPKALGLLYRGAGDIDDYRGFDLGPEARRIAQALAVAPVSSAVLRGDIIGDRAAYERGITELHRSLLVTTAGVAEQRSGWPASVIDLTCRRFDVGGTADDDAAAALFLDTVLTATPAQLARAFGWTAAVAKTVLARLVAAGRVRAGADGHTVL
jgi:hypothetical protein